MRSPNEILKELVQLDFTGRGEAFVESRFITPLLEALGYENHRDYDVIRHGDSGSSFKLRHPSVEAGSKVIRSYNPDFIPTIRKRMFWIVEAKTAVEEGYPFKGTHIIQGLQYCIHPEMQAKYLFLTNGKHSAIYDAHASIFLGRDIYDPLLEFESNALESVWSRLYEILSVERLRGRIEDDLKSMYDRLCLSSLDKHYPQTLAHKIGSSQSENTKTIEANVRRLSVEHMNEAHEAWRKTLESMSSTNLNHFMDTPVGVPPNVGVFHLHAQVGEGKTYNAIAETYLEAFDRKSIFRKEQSVLGLCHLYTRPDVEHDLKDRLSRFFRSLVDAPLPPLSQVECTLLRINRKQLIISFYPGLREKIRKSLETAPEILRFATPPTALGSTYPYELEVHRETFALLEKQTDATLLQALPVFLAIEEDIEEAFRTARNTLPGTETQLGGLEVYGVGGRHFRLAGLLREFGIMPYAAD